MEQGVQASGSDQLYQLKDVGHIDTEEFKVEIIIVLHSKVKVVLHLLVRVLTK